MVDLDREQDIEELRRIAHAQQAQIRILLDALAIKSKEIDQLKGKKGDLQLTLKMLEALQAKAKAADEALAKAEAAQQAKQKAERKPRSSSGPTEQPKLPIVEQEFVLDRAEPHDGTRRGLTTRCRPVTGVTGRAARPLR